MNILEHPIYRAIYDLCQEIEKLPASEQQTKVVVMASDMKHHADELLKQQREAAEILRWLVAPHRPEDWLGSACDEQRDKAQKLLDSLQGSVVDSSDPKH